MAAAKTARLIASLELEDKFSKGIASANKSLGGLETRLGRMGSIAGKGLQTAAGNLAKIGAVAAVGIGAAVKSGIDALAELEDATASVDGAIATLGLTGKVSGKQVADWANEIESDIGAAFDDKEIVAATSRLLRFGKVTPQNLRPAMEVMTDLAVKTGSVESAADLLAKALADPAKAAGKLARSGVILTKEQQDQIKAMVEAGDAAGAQALLLAELEKTTKGAAAATQGPYRRALSIFADVTEDAKKALAVGFLPVLSKLADKLSTALADPTVMRNIESFGRTLASGLDSLIGIAQNLPWAQIGDSLKIAGAGAKAVLGAFVALPPWVQTAVLTGWGLNKLTGGALGGIVKELGAGLIKGVLGMNAAVVNINAGAVNGVPGGGAVPGAAGRLGSVASAVMKVAVVGMAAGVVAALGKELLDQSGQIREQGKAVVENAKTAPLTAQDMQNAINQIDEQIQNPLNSLALAITNPLNGGLDALKATRQSLVQRLDALKTATAAGDERTAARIGSLNSAINATTAAANRTASAISSKNFSPTVNVSTGFTITANISARDQVIAVRKRYSYVGGSTAGGQRPVS